MFAGRGQQSLVLTLTADFRKVRHILFGSGYGAKVNIFKWINYPLLWVESRILILFWFFSFTITFTEYPPPSPLWKIQISNFFPKSKSEVADYPPLWKIQISKFFPKSKFEVADYPPPLWKIQISKFFPKSKFEVADYPPPSGKSKFPNFSLSPNSKLQITPPLLENPNFQIFP